MLQRHKGPNTRVVAKSSGKEERNNGLMKFKQILWMYGERIAMHPYNFAHIAASFSPLPACVGEGAGSQG